MKDEEIKRFVKLWNELKNPKAVAEKLGITGRYAHQVARRLRERGVALHKCKGGRKPSLKVDDIDELKRLAEGGFKR